MNDLPIPYARVTTHTLTGQQFFYRYPEPPYLDNAKECINVHTDEALKEYAKGKLDCRTCENYLFHSVSGSFCYNDEHWRKKCVAGDQHKSLPVIQLWNRK